jgi:hypothetical protein
MPVEIRDDGIPRTSRVPVTGESQIRAQEELMAFLNALDEPRNPDAC